MEAGLSNHGDVEDVPVIGAAGAVIGAQVERLRGDAGRDVALSILHVEALGPGVVGEQAER